MGIDSLFNFFGLRSRQHIPVPLVAGLRAHGFWPGCREGGARIVSDHARRGLPVAIAHTLSGMARRTNLQLTGTVPSAGQPSLRGQVLNVLALSHEQQARDTRR